MQGESSRSISFGVRTGSHFSQKGHLAIVDLSRVLILVKNKNETRRPRSGLKVVRPLTVPKFPFRGGGVAHQPTFDAKSKNAKIQISIFFWGGGLLTSQLLMPSPKMLKSKFPFSGGGGGGGGGCSPANF